MSKQFSKLSKSSKSTEYGTPKGLFDQLNNIFNFVLDPCASEERSLGTERNLTKINNGLKYEWACNTYINPPFGKGVREWIDKMQIESNKNPDFVYVMLLPSRTEVRYFQDLIMWKYRKSDTDLLNSCIYFLKGRLKFVNPVLNGKSQPHIIGSMLWIKNSSTEQREKLSLSIPGVMVEL